MKAKNLFFGALACLAFAACSNDDDFANGNSQANEDVAVIQISISMPEGASTRAESGPEYLAGEAPELDVNKIQLYFFNESGAIWGSPVPVSVSELEWEDQGNNSFPNTINTLSNKFVMLEGVTEANYPKQVVAVINAPDGLVYNTLNDLAANITAKSGSTYLYTGTGTDKTVQTITEGGTTRAKGNFVMSNAVYYHDDSDNSKDKAINTTAIAWENFGTGKDAEEAKQNAETADKPVRIIVERVLARVQVNLTNSEGKFIKNNPAATSTEPAKKVTVFTGYDTNGNATSVDKDIVSIVNGWWLDRTNVESNLIKSIENYSFTSWAWNDETNKRSYWANAVNKDEDSDAKFKHYHYEYGKNNQVDKYCFENTNYNADPEKSFHTQLVVSANLYENESSSLKAISLVQWNTYFFTPDAFLQQVIKQLESDVTLTIKNSSDAKLTTNDIEIAWNTTEGDLSYTIGSAEPVYLRDWQAVVRLKAESGTYSIGGQTNKSVKDVNDHLYTLMGAFKYWNGGQTYYYTDIKHAEGITGAEVGIIRNHWYIINVKSIAGWGTPVPTDPGTTPDLPEDPEKPDTPTPSDPPVYPENPDDPDDPKDPEDPNDPDKPIIPERPSEDQISAIMTDIAILQYRKVTQDVDLK